MNDVAILNGLKDYLTRDYMRLADEKQQLLNEKTRLEGENQKVKDLFFNRKKVNKVRKLFSPIEGYLTDIHNKEKDEESKNLNKIQELENNVNNIDSSMKEIKEYMSYISRLVYELKDVEI